MLILWLGLISILQESSSRLTLSVIDPSGQAVHASALLQSSEPTAGTGVEPLQREVDSDGRMELDCSLDETDDRCCFLYAKGFAIDLLSLKYSISRSLTITMVPESDIDVLVVDLHGAPVVSARVTPGRIRFRESAWIANVPYRLPDYYESTTDNQGVAKLHGVVADQLSSVRVSFGDSRGCTYQIPDRWDRKSKLIIESNPVVGSLLCKLRDANGAPVPNARVYAETSEESVNPLATTKPTQLFSEFLGKTGEDGSLSLDEVTAGMLDIRFFANDARVGVGMNRRDFEIKPNQLNVLEVSYKPTFPVIATVIDADTGAGISNVTIGCQIIEKGEYINAFAKTNEDGIAELELQVGQWRFSLMNDWLPMGYCVLFPDRTPQLAISESSEIQVGPSLLISRGTRIDGEIRGIEPRKLRHDWIAVENSDTTWMGRFSDDGKFSMVVPKDVGSLEFQIGTPSRTGKLEVESKNPWILKWVEREKKDTGE